MRQADRGPFDVALLPARQAAFPPGQFIGQESFMRAEEILSLALRAGVAPGTSVLDLCCGVAGPGRFLTGALGCTYLGVDASPGAIELARRRAAGLPCRFEVAEVPPLPPGRFDVVLLLETMLAFADKQPLFVGVAEALPPGGRFAFTVEEGAPLSAPESALMPDADTVWPVLLPEIVSCLERVGLVVQWSEEVTRLHHEVAESLIQAFSAERAAISAQVGSQALDDLVDGHRLWSHWFATGRMRKFAIVAVKPPAGPSRAAR